MAYCVEADLLVAKIPIPDYLDVQKIIDDAADEIDSKIGWRYETPIDVSLNGGLARPARLLLKRINAALASGRLILQVATPEENNSLHAYGWSLVREANGAINVIADGSVELVGADLVATPVEPTATPLISNLDSESSVEAFYDRIANPSYSYPLPLSVYHSPDRLVE